MENMKKLKKKQFLSPDKIVRDYQFQVEAYFQPTRRGQIIYAIVELSTVVARTKHSYYLTLIASMQTCCKLSCLLCTSTLMQSRG